MTREPEAARGLPADELVLERVGPWLQGRRWYASKSRHLTAVTTGDWAELPSDPALAVVLVRAEFADGGHDVYQLPLTLLPRAQASQPAPMIEAGDRVGVPAIEVDGDLAPALELLRQIEAELTLETASGCLRFRRVGGSLAPALEGAVRPVGAEQSHSSVVFGELTVLKVLRRLEAGINPELELLQFLTRQEFPNIAPLQGWYEYEGRVMDATLGVAQRYVAGATDGWDLAMAQIGADPARLIIELGELGAVTAALHNALASDASDPAFRPEEPSGESMSMMMATVEEDVERIFARLPEDERLAAIAGRGPDVRERIASRGWVAGGGRAIRTHGDLHLGQTLRLADDWLIIDFEGEPARPLHERRRKHSPLRDVAGMLRSFAYAAAAARLIHGTWVPAQFEQRAREAFLERYFASVDAALLPPGEAATADLLSIFELEKAVYELRYELDNRPDWLAIPAAGIAALLEVT